MSKLGGIFSRVKSAGASALERQKLAQDAKEGASDRLAQQVTPGGALAKQRAQVRKPGSFNIDWGQPRTQGIKNYKAITTRKELIDYILRCEETGLGGFDWETAADQATRDRWLVRLIQHERDRQEAQAIEDEKAQAARIKALEGQFKTDYAAYLKTPLDPWQGEVCTASISAAADESRVIPISNKKGDVFEPGMTREAARDLFFSIMERFFFRSSKIVKIAFNLPFETKWAMKYGVYIKQPVADPQMQIVRCLQIGAPQRIKDQKKPATGWGLKPSTEVIFKVKMGEFAEVLARAGAEFFDEVDASEGEGLVYSAEDADYAVQHYEYWLGISKQIPGDLDPNHPGLDVWLATIEMPFMRVIGQMEYWGMKWDPDQADVKRQEAKIAQEQAAEDIRTLLREATGLEVNVGKGGKTGDMTKVMFDTLKLPVAKVSDKGNISTDKESLIDIEFMLHNNLNNIDEEEYLHIELPEGWEQIDPETDPKLDKDTRMALRIKKREAHPNKETGLKLIGLLKKMAKYNTLIGTHIESREAWLNPVSGRIHANYMTWTETSRCNCFKPNGQNVPRPDNDELKIRNFFVPAPGKVLFLIDFAGFELRILSWKTDDEVMIELFNTGGDMHKRTASTMTGKPEADITKVERGYAKEGNFGIGYGGTEWALQTTFKVKLGIRKTLHECAQIVKAVKETYKRIPEFQEKIKNETRAKGFVDTIFGYIRLLPGINGTKQSDKSAAARAASNTPIQGSAADIMKWAQIAVYDQTADDTWEYKESYNPEAADYGMDTTGRLVHGHTDQIAQIHDEIIFEMDDVADHVEQAGTVIKAFMERLPVEDFPVPILAEASAGYQWGEKMDLDKWLEKRRSA